MSQNIVFVDSRVTNYDTLVAGLGADTPWYLLSAEQDGITQMQRILAGYSGLDSIHVVSHGSPGAVYLGSTVLNSDNLANYASQWQGIGARLSQTGDILLYGCNVAAGTEGEKFIADLANVTRADVAASIDTTGPAALGGDGVLERSVGVVDTLVLDISVLSGQLAAAGVVTTDLGSAWDSGNSVATQADGKILVSGARWNGGSYELVVVRYHSNGRLDSSFSDDGVASAGLAIFRSRSGTVIAQADGKILVGSTVYDVTNTYPNGVFHLARFNADGSLDSSFGVGGHVSTSVGEEGDGGLNFALQTDGKILVAGNGMARYNEDGSHDRTFGQDGFVETGSYCRSIIPQANGKILVVCDTASGALIERYNPDGTHDVINFRSSLLDGIYVQPEAIAIQADDSILIAGTKSTGLEIAFLRPNKVIDELVFDKVAEKAYASEYIANAMVVQADGKILVSGYFNNNPNNWDSLVLSRFNADGTPDLNFGANGDIITSLDSDDDNGKNLELLDSGQILVTGRLNGDLAVARYNADGRLDTTFGLSATNPENHLPFGRVSINGMLKQGQKLNATNTLADPDGLGTISYQWLADGMAIDDAVGSTFTLTQAQVGKAVTVQASYTDLLGTTESMASSPRAKVSNVNDAPTGGVSISGTPAQGQKLAVAHTLADADGLGTIKYQWLADGAAIKGATGSTLTLTQAQVGKAISVRASYTDQFGTAESVSSVVTAQVSNVNDAPTGGVTISGTATQGQKLKATNTMDDADGLGAVTYQWLADGTVINGATGAILTLTQAQVGKAISVRASYTDKFGAAESLSSVVTPKVSNANDAPTGSVTISGTAIEGHQLTAVNTVDDVDGLGAITYQWMAGGVAISGATGSTLTLTQAQVGKTISVRASYTDQFGTAERVSVSVHPPCSPSDSALTCS